MIDKAFSKRYCSISLDHFLDTFFFIINLKKITENEVSMAKNLLDELTINRANRFFLYKDYSKFLITHAALRVLLGQKINLPPREIVFFYNQFGKPYLKNHSFQFNLSYTNDFAFIGMHPSYSIGVDIESIQNNSALLKASKFVMYPSEEDLIASSTNPIECFYNLWCAKEALLKAMGTGFLIDTLPLLYNEPSMSIHYEKFSFSKFQIYVYNNRLVNHKLAVCLLK